MPGALYSPGHKPGRTAGRPDASRAPQSTAPELAIVKDTPRQTLDALRRQLDAGRKMATVGKFHDSRIQYMLPIAMQIAGLVLDLVEHQVANWERADRLDVAFRRAIEMTAAGEDPLEVLRELTARMRPN